MIRSLYTSVGLKLFPVLETLQYKVLPDFYPCV